MKDNIFIDTNVLVYAKLEDEENKRKRDTAISLIRQIKDPPIVSVQVLNEFSSILIKHHISNLTIQQAIREIIDDSIVISIDIDLIWKAWSVREKYLFSYWDSLVIAAALTSGCKILYSEDLQHNQLIENQVRIINPF
jgi:predicted nucleic acid-binding protein